MATASRPVSLASALSPLLRRPPRSFRPEIFWPVVGRAPSAAVARRSGSSRRFPRGYGRPLRSCLAFRGAALPIISTTFIGSVSSMSRTDKRNYRHPRGACGYGNGSNEARRPKDHRATGPPFLCSILRIFSASRFVARPAVLGGERAHRARIRLARQFFSLALKAPPRSARRGPCIFR